MRKGERIFNRIIEYGIIFLIIFTPLAFGSVEVWATEVMKMTIFLIAAAWLLKKIWFAEKKGSPQMAGEAGTKQSDQGEDSQRQEGRAVLSQDKGGNSFHMGRRKWTRTGLEIPALIFVVFILLQLIPLPPSLLKVVSPHSYQLNKMTLPGYDTPEGVDYNKMDEWLLKQEKDLPEELREIILKEGAERRHPAFNIKGSNFRTLSVYSYLTREHLILLLAYLSIFFIIIDHYRTREKVYRLLLIIIVSGLLIASFGIIQKLTWNGKIYWLRSAGEGVSPFGPFVNRDHFAGYMELIVPLAFGLFFTLISRKIETEEGKVKWKIDMGRDGWNITEVEEFSIQKAFTLGFLLAITIASIFMSLSRGGLVATSITFILFAALLFIGKRKSMMEIITMASVLGVSFIVLITIGLTPVKERIETLTGFSIESAFFKGRMAVWKHTLELIRDFPLFGSGLGTFRQAFLSYYPSGSASVWNQTHNDYLQLLSEVGIVGFLIFLVGLFLFFIKYYRKAVFERSNADRYINLGLAMAIFSMGLHSFVDFNLQIPSNGFLFVVLMALLIASKLWTQERAADSIITSTL
ncbi:MAG: O-antigen ligase family protein [Acidobacteriota bacterium]